MDNERIVAKIRSVVDDRGYKIVAISDKTGIDYQRLNRIFNQGATLSAVELMQLCLFLGIPMETLVNKQGEST